MASALQQLRQSKRCAQHPTVVCPQSGAGGHAMGDSDFPHPPLGPAETRAAIAAHLPFPVNPEDSRFIIEKILKLVQDKIPTWFETRSDVAAKANERLLNEREFGREGYWKRCDNWDVMYLRKKQGEIAKQIRLASWRIPRTPMGDFALRDGLPGR